MKTHRSQGSLRNHDGLRGHRQDLKPPKPSHEVAKDALTIIKILPCILNALDSFSLKKCESEEFVLSNGKLSADITVLCGYSGMFILPDCL